MFDEDSGLPGDSYQRGTYQLDTTYRGTTDQGITQQGTSDHGTSNQGTPQTIKAPQHTAFLDPAKQQFREWLTPLMLRGVKAQKCLCVACTPAFMESLIH